MSLAPHVRMSEITRAEGLIKGFRLARKGERGGRELDRRLADYVRTAKHLLAHPTSEYFVPYIDEMLISDIEEFVLEQSECRSDVVPFTEFPQTRSALLVGSKNSSKPEGGHPLEAGSSDKKSPSSPPR
jgi:hypothetical protein